MLSRFLPSLWLAAALIGGLFSAAQIASAAIIPSASVTLSVIESPSPVASGGKLTYTISLSNPQVPVKVCDTTDGLKPQVICYWDTDNGPLSGITVTDTLPAGVIYTSVSATNGFSCGLNGSTLTCANGSIAALGSATISIAATAPSLYAGATNATLTNSVAVAPGNETALTQTTVMAPPPLPAPLPDLTITSFTGGGSVARGGRVTYTATIANIGQAPANQVQLAIAGGIDAVQILGAETGDPGTTPCLGVAEPSGFVTLCPNPSALSLAAGQSATVTIAAQVLANAPTGTFQMHASADPYNVVQESNENNNTTWGATTTIY